MHVLVPFCYLLICLCYYLSFCCLWLVAGISQGSGICSNTRYGTWS